MTTVKSMEKLVLRKIKRGFGLSFFIPLASPARARACRAEFHRSDHSAKFSQQLGHSATSQRISRNPDPYRPLINTDRPYLHQFKMPILYASLILFIFLLFLYIQLTRAKLLLGKSQSHKNCGRPTDRFIWGPLL